MNRIQLWLDEPDVADSADNSCETSPLQFTQTRELPHSLFTPLHYEPNYEYPLLVWLHGPNDDEHQLNCVMPYLSLQNYVAIGPRGCSKATFSDMGFQWNQTTTAIDEAERRVHEAIRIAMRRSSIAADRVFIGGYQCGGTMAMQIATRCPQQFAGAISIGGPFPEQHSPLAHWSAVRELPLLIVQGRDSEDYPQQRLCEELKLFHAASMHVTVRQYPCGDELTTKMLADMNAWMMERVTGQPAEPDDTPYAMSPHDFN